MSPKPRTRPDNLPEHIALRDIPRGVYWDKSGRGRWYVFVMRNGRKARETIAAPDVRASDLHRIMEERSGVQRESLLHLCNAFHESPTFRGLAERTQADYERQRKIVETHRIQAGTLGALRAAGMTPPLFRRLLDSMAETPTKANHLARYLKRVFSWGVESGLARSNPVKGVRLLKEKADAKMPTREAHAAFLATLDGWLLAACELAYLCRLRRVEVATLMESAATDRGIVTSRRKGSRATLTCWSPRLRAAWDLAIAERNKRWDKQRMAWPMRAEGRPVFIGRHGGQLTEDGFSTSFDRAMAAFAAAGGQRFSLHGLKHRGITDSDDKRAGGHRTEAMRQRYDHAVHEFPAAGITEGITEAPKARR